MIVVVERVGEDLIAEVAAVPRQLFFGERLSSADKLARDAAAPAPLAQTILYRLHLHVVPVRPERTENTPVVRHVAVPVGRAFPNAHRREVRRL